VAVAVKAINKFPSTYIYFSRKKYCLQDILFVVYLQLALKWETNYDDKHKRYLLHLCSTSFHKTNCLCSSQTTISVQIGFDTRSKTGVIFLWFPSHCSLFLRPLGGTGKVRRENWISAFLEMYPGRQPLTERWRI
jgi:hypothetical protein